MFRKDWHEGYLAGLTEAMLIAQRQSAWAQLKLLQVERSRAQGEMEYRAGTPNPKKDDAV